MYPKNLPPHPKSASALPCKKNKNILANVAGIQKGSVFQTHSVHNTTWNMTVTVNFFANLVLQ